MVDVEIYTKSYCPYCANTKAVLTELEVKFKDHELDNDADEFEKLKEKTGHMTVPQIFIDGKFIGGNDDLMALVQSGEIHNLLGKK